MAKRRKRRSSTELLAKRTLIEIKQKKHEFLREVSKLLSDALGFTVKVSLSKPDRMAGLSSSQRKYARMTQKDLRKQMQEAFEPLAPGS
jgi:hypothetical protein